MFRFSIADLGVFLGKAPATLRSWERKGLITFPRVANRRLLSISEVQTAAHAAYDAERITEERLTTITNALARLYELQGKEL